MSLVKGICPNCGGIVQIDKQSEAVICQYCGVPFVVEKAIKKYIMENNNHKCFNGSDVNIYDNKKENAYEYFNKAKTCLKLGYTKDVQKNIKKALILEPDNMEIKFWCMMYGNRVRVPHIYGKEYIKEYPDIQDWETNWLLDKNNSWVNYFSYFFDRSWDRDKWWDRHRCDYVFQLLNVNFDDWCFRISAISGGEWEPTDKLEYIFKKDIHKLYNPYKLWTYDTYEGPNDHYTEYSLALHGSGSLGGGRTKIPHDSNPEIANLMIKYYPIQPKIDRKICPSCGGNLNFLKRCKSCSMKW